MSEVSMIVREKAQNRQLAVRLTEDEKLERLREMAGVMAEIKEAEIRFDKATQLRKDLKEVVDDQVARGHGIAEIVNTGLEIRSVECDEILDYSTSRVIVRRRDTNTAISIRNMTDLELQTRMFDDENPADPEEVENIVHDFFKRGGTEDGEELAEAPVEE